MIWEDYPSESTPPARLSLESSIASGTYDTESVMRTYTALAMLLHEARRARLVWPPPLAKIMGIPRKVTLPAPTERLDMLSCCFQARPDPRNENLMGATSIVAGQQLYV